MSKPNLDKIRELIEKEELVPVVLPYDEDNGYAHTDICYASEDGDIYNDSNGFSDYVAIKGRGYFGGSKCDIVGLSAVREDEKEYSTLFYKVEDVINATFPNSKFQRFEHIESFPDYLISDSKKVYDLSENKYVKQANYNGVLSVVLYRPSCSDSSEYDDMFIKSIQELVEQTFHK